MTLNKSAFILHLDLWSHGSIFAPAALKVALMARRTLTLLPDPINKVMQRLERVSFLSAKCKLHFQVSSALV